MKNNFKKFSIILFFYIIILLFIYPRYYFLIWNLFLAYIPFYLSFKYYNLKNKILKIINLFISLIFYPNAIYLFTDLIHIQNMRFYIRNHKKVEYLMNINEWIKLSLIFIAILIALKMSYITIKNYSNLIKNVYYKNILIIIVSFLSGIAVFIGRFIRLNSWNLITHPTDTVLIILYQLNLENIKFIIIFMLIQYFLIILENENFNIKGD